jgi:hypothetical protein
MNQLIVHQATKGTENENSLARVVQNLVPTRFGVGSGLLIDSHGGVSKQMDLIIFEQGNEPALLAQTNQVLFPVENVRLCIEVKTGLGKSQIEDARQKKASLESLKPSSGTVPPMALFAFRGDQTAKTLADHLDTVTTGDGPRPDMTAVVNLGLLVGALGSTNGTGVWTRGVTALQELDANGDALIGTCDQPWQYDDTFAVRKDIAYPIVNVETRGDILAEPSRALLLFAEWLVDAIGSSSVMSAYIDGPTRDVIAV